MKIDKEIESVRSSSVDASVTVRFVFAPDLRQTLVKIEEVAPGEVFALPIRPDLDRVFGTGATQSDAIRDLIEVLTDLRTSLDEDRHRLAPHIEKQLQEIEYVLSRPFVKEQRATSQGSVREGQTGGWRFPHMRRNNFQPSRLIAP